MASLVRFYGNEKYISIIIPIIKGTSSTPLRLYNWFVTNYCKDNHVIIKKSMSYGEAYTNVYMNYKTQLKTYSKAQFDPFRRDEKRRIIFNYDATDSEKSIETTVGQLNFFKWAIETGVMDYVFKHRAVLEAEMRSVNNSGHVSSTTSVSGSESASETDSIACQALECSNTNALQNKPIRSSRNEVQKITTLDRTTVITFD
jgi:hypothetical protein